MVSAVVLFLLTITPQAYCQVDYSKRNEALRVNAKNECLQKYIVVTNVLSDKVYQEVKSIFERIRGYEEICTTGTVDGVTNTTLLRLLQNLEVYDFINSNTAYSIMELFKNKGPALYFSQKFLNNDKNEIHVCLFGRCIDPLENTSMCFLYSCCKVKLYGPSVYDNENHLFLTNGTRLSVEDTDLIWKYMKHQAIIKFKEDQSLFHETVSNNALSLRSYLSIEVQQCLKHIEDNSEKKLTVFCTLANVTVQVDY